MKIIFNDATEIAVQQVESHGDYLRILTVGNTPEQLKVLLTDASRTARMIVQERGQTIATYEGYTAFYRTEIYTGKIYGVVMYKQETLPEETAGTFVDVTTFGGMMAVVTAIVTQFANSGTHLLKTPRSAECTVYIGDAAPEGGGTSGGDDDDSGQGTFG